MRTRRVIALIAATAIVFSLAGAAVGYWVLPEGKGPSATCVIYHSALESGLYADLAQEFREDIFEYYNDNCR